MYEKKDENTINWIDILIKDLERSWKKIEDAELFAEELRQTYKNVDEKEKEEEKIEWLQQISLAENQVTDAKLKHRIQSNQLCHDMRDKLGVEAYFLAKVEELCAIGRLAPQLIDEIDPLMDVLHEANNFKQSQLKQLAAFYPSLTQLYADKPEVILNIIPQLLQTALENNSVLKVILFTPGIYSCMTTEQHALIQNHVLQNVQLSEILKDRNLQDTYIL